MIGFPIFSVDKVLILLTSSRIMRRIVFRFDRELGIVMEVRVLVTTSLAHHTVRLCDGTARRISQG